MGSSSPGAGTRGRARVWPVVGRYVLFQLPELVIVCGALAAGVVYGVVSETWGLVLVGIWLLKEVVLFPFVRQAYESSDPAATSLLVGKRAVVTERLDPGGRVRIGPELWRACLAPGAEPVDPGGIVCVRSVEGLTLHVEASREGQPPEPSGARERRVDPPPRANS